MTTSWRSPGTTTSRPSVSTRRPAGTPWANTATSFDAPGQVTLVSTRGFQLADQVAHPQPGQLGAMRHRGDEA